MFRIIYGAAPAPCSLDTSIDITDGTHLIDGSIYFRGIHYERSEHYFDNVTNTERGCICKKRKCMQKCCPQGQVLRSYGKKCINSSIPFDPPIWDKYKRLQKSIGYFDFHYIYKITQCTKGEYL
ncbi:hypothetical protein EVAR_49086_1 [Eumeta japonica]|uniref:Methuselah N-terminal domain-containing protein n=1 Tax=Eumeta variegata TaxID=151549 RepID=A0A4C1ZAF7_EUMVA|nr:hypothetical protein EVAR_49086_1 [Eumeta japonica]